MSTLQELSAALCAPFPSDLIDLKPGALTRDRTRALAMAYADTRVYQERLDQTVGPDHWSVRFDLTPTGAICTLTIVGVTKADVGDYPPDHGEKANENRTTTAAAQAFKRACAQFGLGRYLYALPRTWADYDSETRQFVAAPAIVMSLYQAAGLHDCITDVTNRALRGTRPSSSNGTAPTSAPSEPPFSAQSHAPAPVEKIARARAALADAETRTIAPLRVPPPAEPTRSTTNGKPASEKQVRYLIRLLKAANVNADELDALAHQVSIDSALLSRPERLEQTGLPAKAASTLIEELLALSELHTA